MTWVGGAETTWYVGAAELCEKPKRSRSGDVRPLPVVLAVIVRLLPPSERARYLEEFRAELLDIHPGRRLWHARSLLRGAFVLRLRRGHNNKAADAAVRRAKN
jgi:hypothetical protein